MDVLESAGFLLALAMLAGLNVYLTVFLTGLAVRFEWFGWSGQIEAMDAFGDPVVLGVALVLILVEFGIDKVPWADSLWDGVHTLLRPAGGVLLAVAAIGPEAGMAARAAVGLGAGVVALLTHLTRAGLRLGINTSPEPFSNIAASLATDVAVIAGFLVAINHPLAALVVFGVPFAAVVYFAPATLRQIRAMLWLIRKKLRASNTRIGEPASPLPDTLSTANRILVAEALADSDAAIAWAVPCVTGNTRGIAGFGRHQFGHLVAREHPGAALCFVTRRRFARNCHLIDLRESELTRETHFLFECLVIADSGRNHRHVLRFHRGMDGMAERIADFLRSQSTRVPAEDPPVRPDSPTPAD